MTGDVDYLGRLLVAEAWSASNAYTLGEYAELSTGEVLKATAGGTSGASEPTAPGYGETVTDGDVTWEQVTG